MRDTGEEGSEEETGAWVSWCAGRRQVEAEKLAINEEL